MHTKAFARITFVLQTNFVSLQINGLKKYLTLCTVRSPLA